MIWQCMPDVFSNKQKEDGGPPFSPPHTRIKSHNLLKLPHFKQIENNTYLLKALTAKIKSHVCLQCIPISSHVSVDLTCNYNSVVVFYTIVLALK